MEQLKRWLSERPTPLLWVYGPADCGKTTAVESAVRDDARPSIVLRFSAFDADHAFGALTNAEHEPLTTMQLLRLASDQRIVVLDGLDALQQTAGQHAGAITDTRFAQLLLSACRGALPGAAIIVTSRMPLPALLLDGSSTVIEMHESSAVGPLSLPATGSLERRVLEFAALNRLAIDPVTLQRMSGIGEAVIARVLSSAVKEGLVTRVSPTSYQVPDRMRSAVLSDAARTHVVRAAAIEALQQDGRAPECLLGLLVDHGNIDAAVDVYWNTLGNYQRLHEQGRDYFGAQLCRRLNDGLGPDEVSRDLGASDGVWAVLNDWSQFAACSGDARASALAAESAYQTLPQDLPPWYAAIVAAHLGQALAMSGNLRSGMEWCERSWNHARLGLRQTQGVAAREIMDAYDWSANTIAKTTCGSTRCRKSGG